MPISTISASTNDRARSGSRAAAGFTLVELGLVILILAVAATIVVPRLGDRARADLVSHARRLALTFRHLRHEAILTGQVHRLVYDLERHRYFVLSSDGRTFRRVGDRLGRGIRLPDPVAFADVYLPATAGKVYDGLAATDFYPTGEVDPTVVHLSNGTEAYTVQVEPLTGRVAVYAGYFDITYTS